MTDPQLHDDFLDLLDCLAEYEVRYLVVGAHALAAHGVARATGDIDIWVAATAENAGRLMQALLRFGAPLKAHGVSKTDFERAGTVYQLGLPPRRIDILTSISGVDFEEAWPDRVAVEAGSRPLTVLGRDALLTNKRSAGRPKDLLDVAALENE